MFMAFRLTNREKALSFLAAQSGLRQNKASVSLSLRISVLPPHTGQVSGISIFPDLVRFSEIWGMIMLAL